MHTEKLANNNNGEREKEGGYLRVYVFVCTQEQDEQTSSLFPQETWAPGTPFSPTSFLPSVLSATVVGGSRASCRRFST